MPALGRYSGGKNNPPPPLQPMDTPTNRSTHKPTHPVVQQYSSTFSVCGLFPARIRRRAREDKARSRLDTKQEPAVRHEELSVGQATPTRDPVFLFIFTRQL